MDWMILTAAPQAYVGPENFNGQQASAHESAPATRDLGTGEAKYAAEQQPEGVSTSQSDMSFDLVIGAIVLANLLAVIALYNVVAAIAVGNVIAATVLFFLPNQKESRTALAGPAPAMN